MEIRILDFELLTRHYIKYQEGIKKITEEKNIFLDKIKPIEKEMNTIIASFTSGLIIDNETQEQKREHFSMLQEQLTSQEKDLSLKIKEMSMVINRECYEDLSDIVKKWSISHNIDLVLSKNEVVYVRETMYDSTEEILNILKQMNIFVEYSQ
jgi:Skp family chaperone for outer membrane proteins